MWFSPKSSFLTGLILALCLGAAVSAALAPAALAQMPTRRPAASRPALLPAPLRDSVARTVEPVARRVLLERLVARYPADPMPHTELAASLLANPLIRLGWGGGNEPSTDRARDQLEAALRADPAYVPAAVALVDYALRTHDDRDLRLARDRAGEAAGLNPGDANAAVALVRVAAEQGDAAGALAAEQKVAALVAAGAPGGAPAAQAAGIALMLVPGHEAEGAQLYLRGLREGSPELRQAYLRDIRYLLPDSTYERWKVLPATLADSIEAFWQKHASAAGVAVPERVAEHFRRLRLAVRQYAMAERGQKWAPPPSAILHAAELEREFDDRGLIYLKHGRPQHVTSGHSPRLDPNESWVYDLPDGTRQIFFFVATRNASGFRLVSEPFAAVPEMETTRSRVGEALAIDALATRPEVLDLLEELGKFDARYQLLASNLRSVATMGGPVAAGSRATEMRISALDAAYTRAQDLSIQNEKQALRLLQRETYVPPFAGDLPFSWALYQLRGGSGARLVAALAVPAENLQRTEAGGTYTYAFRVLLTVADTMAGRAWRVDTSIAIRTAAALRPEDALRVQVPLDVQPAQLAAYRITVRSGDGAAERGKVYGGDLAVRSYPAGALSMSDIVIASARPGSWHRGGVALALNPWETFVADRAFPVFYEVYGLAPGAAYRTTIDVTPDPEGLTAFARERLAGRKPLLRLQFQGQAALESDGALQEVRDVRPQLAPGSYRLRVTVEDQASRRSTSAERRFRLLAAPKS